MRTGAIFARGSCRALKWMALFGVVFALGAVQAAAQPTITAQTFEPNTNTITLTASALVDGSPPASAFTVNVTPMGGTAGPNIVTNVGSIAHGQFSTTIELTVATELKTGSTVTFTYAPAVPATATNQIRDAADMVLAAITAAATVTEADQVPLFAQQGDLKLTMGDRINTPLPMATRGNQPFTYTLSLASSTGTPTGTTFTAATPITALAATNGDTDHGFRFVGGPNPTLLGSALVTGVYTLTYTVADTTGDGSTAGQSIPQSFKITVSSVPTDPTGTAGIKPRITKIVVDGATEKTIDGTKRMHVQEGQQTKVTVTLEWSYDELRKLWAAAGTGMPADVMVMFNMMPMPGTGSAANWLSAAEDEAGHDDVTIGTGAVVKVPKIPATRSATARGFDTASGSTSLNLGQDSDAETEGFYLMVADSGNFESRSLTQTGTHVIEDDEVQGVVLKRDGSGVIYEGGPQVKFDVTASPARVQLPLNVRFNLTDVSGQTVADRKNIIDKASGTIPIGSGKDTITITLDKNDGNRTDDTLKIHAEVVINALDSGNFDDRIAAQEMEIKVIDVHKLPEVTVAVDKSTIEEGGKAKLTYTINRNPRTTIVLPGEVREYSDEALTITLSMGGGTATSDDYRIMDMTLKVDKHSGKAADGWMQTAAAEVEIRADEIVEGMETLMISAAVAGADNMYGTGSEMPEGAMATLNIEDATAKYVWAKTQEEVEAAIYAAKNAGAGDDMTFTAGEMIEVMGSALFSAAEGVTLSYTAESDMSDVASVSVSGGTVMVTAAGEGMAHITITAHASMPSGAMVVDQTDPREASVKFPVEVGLEALSIMLSGPEDMNLAEGMSAMVTATANRAVSADTMVMLMRDRSMSSAGDDDFMAEAITIKAGEMMGSTMVMAVEDNMAEDMEELVLYGMTEGMAGEVTGEVKLYIWDAAVPALPIIAQLLLAAFLAIGGYRRYLRR